MEKLQLSNEDFQPLHIDQTESEKSPEKVLPIGRMLGEDSAKINLP